MRYQAGGVNLKQTEETMKHIFNTLLLSTVLLTGTVHAASGTEYTANFVPYMVTSPTLCPEADLATGNKDVKGLQMLLTRQMAEMSTSASASVPEILLPDRARINSYISELEGYQSQINASTPADYPGTHKLYYCLFHIENPPVVTSQAINDLLVLWTLTNGELLTSSSSGIPAGLRVPDNNRLSGHIQSMKNYLLYLDGAAVQDYPRQAVITDRIRESAGITRNQ